MKILVGTDGSADAVTAATRGLAVLAAPDAVVVMCVVQTPAAATAGMESGFAGGMATPEAVDAAWVNAADEAEEAIDRTVAGLPPELVIERRVESGDPGPALIRVGDDLDVDVIVVGSRGRGAVKRALLGSVSTSVATHAGRPVLVIGAG